MIDLSEDGLSKLESAAGRYVFAPNDRVILALVAALRLARGAECDRCGSVTHVCEVEAPGFIPGNATCCSCIALAYEELGARMSKEISAAKQKIREQRKSARVDAEKAEAHELSSTRRAEKAEAELAQLRDRLESVEHVRGEERSAWMAECARLRLVMDAAEALSARIRAEGGHGHAVHDLAREVLFRVGSARKALRVEAGDG